jgi:hypothetical protein
MISDSEKNKIIGDVAEDILQVLIRSHVDAVIDSNFGNDVLPNLTKKTIWQRYANWLYQKMTGENPHKVVYDLRSIIIEERFKKNMEIETQKREDKK